MRILALTDDYWHPAKVPHEGLSSLAEDGFDFDSQQLPTPLHHHVFCGSLGLEIERFDMTWSNHALQRTAGSRPGWQSARLARLSLSLGR